MHMSVCINAVWIFVSVSNVLRNYTIYSLLFSVEFLQRQLKNLKDSLKKCLDKRQRMTRSGAAASSLPKCKYFEQMKFLYEKTANKPTDSNLAPISAEQVTTCVDDIPSTPIQSTGNATQRKGDEMLLPPSSSRHGFKTRQDVIDTAILKQLEMTDKQINESFSKEESNDETSLYCKILNSIINALPLKKRRLATIKISQLLSDIEFEQQ